jgi:hypothetical protein
MPSKTPSPLDTARAFYGDAFNVRRKRDLAQSMTDWTDLGDDEQRFTIAHLLYLNLEAQAAQQRLLARLCGLVDELADAMGAALELSLPNEDDVEPDFELPPEPEAPSSCRWRRT